jgi:hypothetical protein
MRAKVIQLSKTMITVAVAMTVVALLVQQPVSWEIATLALFAALVVFGVGLGGPWRSAGRPAASHAQRVSLPRLLRVRISVRGIMVMVACVAILLFPVHCCLQLPYYEEQAQFHGFMAQLCRYEAEMMTGRANACSARARNGVAWDDPSEEAEVLKCCPYLTDTPRYASWSEQAAVWARAASKAASAADRHAGLAEYGTWRRPIELW